MRKYLARHCPSCKEYQSSDITSENNLFCPQCSSNWGEVKNKEDVFDYCPVCDCRQFYMMKKFNQALGCLIMLIGIVLVPATYGLSLPVFALIDWILNKRVSTFIVCYKCGSEFHGFDEKKRFKPFMHHIGLKYDKFR